VSVPGNAEAMVFASFAADALALGAHWIYDTRQIEARFGRVTDFLQPAAPTYHPAKSRGEFTHYGDQTLVLLRSVAACNGFDEAHFGGSWQEFFRSYGGYFDSATKQTLQNLAAGRTGAEAASSSDDLAGAARIGPLVYRYRDEPERLADCSRRQTALTHRSPEVIAAADFFSRVTGRVLRGERPFDALRRAADADGGGTLAKWVEAGIASASVDTRSAMRGFGQMCAIAAAFPATVHLIAKYEDRLEEGLVENVMAGGDSAGRGLLAGLVLGAWGGFPAIPQRWRTGLAAADEIDRLLARIRPDGGA
jgi:ADP-ribosylglycohydrolase